MLLTAAAVPAFAQRYFSAETAQADALYSMGLFRGTGKDPAGKPIYALEHAPSRGETLILLIRLLGKEQEAFSGT